MKLKKKYVNLDDTLFHLKLQVKHSIPFARVVVPKFSHPRELFDWLKKRVRYKNDPPGTELLQEMGTLLRGDYWGTPGMGDCDCFTIATIASAIVNGWEDISIVLVGREKSHPVHIYTVIYWDGKRYVLDLTNQYFDQERDSYRYKQEVPVNWKIWKFKK
jgi:hypothetical protein